MTGQPVPTTGAAPAPAEPAAPPVAPAAPEPAPAAPEPVPAVAGAGPAVDVYEPAGPASEPAAGRSGDAAGEIRSDGIPRWLAAVFVIVPAFAVMYALFLPNGPSCGDAGRLAVDPVTGVAVNCDGSEYGVEVVDFFAVGQEVYAQCSSCHGANGGGGGNFPAFVDGALVTVFPEGTCEDHVEWVRVGTADWPDSTYGANAKPVGGSGAVMPGFGSAISEEELRAVVLYERVRFGGLALDATLADCGLAEEPEPAG
jgi:mono/diheme cytochrome c family protein